MEDKDFYVLGYNGNYGVETDDEGGTITETINIEGIKISKAMLAKCFSMSAACVLKSLGFENEKARLFATDALSLVHLLHGISADMVQFGAESSLLMIEEEYKRYYQKGRYNRYAPKRKGSVSK